MFDPRAQDVLRELLARGQVAQDRVRDVLLPAGKIKGYPFRNAQQCEDFHEVLKLAEHSGAIALEWMRYHEGVQLERVRLKDAEQLAAFLGDAYLPTRIAMIFASLDTSGLPDWCEAALATLKERWLSGKAAFGLVIGDADKLPALLVAVRALETLPADQPLDYRQFGARFLGDSKLTRVLATPLAALYRTREMFRDLGRDEILALLNLVPLAQPVLLRGPVTLSDGQQLLNADVLPYLGVPTTFLHTFAAERPPVYLLTIENQSSFNEYTASVMDDGLVIYTAGFPTRALQLFYRHAVEQFDVPLYHWGDTDIGGFRILKMLQQLCPQRIVQPHQMGLPGGVNVSSGQMKDLERLLPINTPTDEAIKRVLARECGFQEQETMPVQAITF